MNPTTVNGVTLYVDTYGDPSDPTILLIGGAGGSMDWWEPDFCRQLAGGRCVIRYDMRDTEQSVTYPPGWPGYTGEDLANDAVGVPDALGVRTAHPIGISMGGALAQRIAAEHPERVDDLVRLGEGREGTWTAKA
jgi:pimeloyl-ACP methyl ester carboxylesterase